MGQQQLLLIVLGVIIVGIAIAVGISMFKSNAQSSNRDQIINDLTNLAAKAQQYYRKPVAMAGGGQSFDGFALTTLDTGDANGSYSVTTSLPTGAAFVSFTHATISSAGVPSGTALVGSQVGAANPINAVAEFAIIGQGTETGNDGTNPVEAWADVTPNGPIIHVLN